MNARIPAEVFPPGEFLKEELEARGWTQVELSEILDRPPRLVSEIVSGKRAITPETAKGLAAAFEGTSPHYWMNLETSYQLSKAELETSVVSLRAKLYGNFPVKEMIRRGWIEPSDNLDVLVDRFLQYFEIRSLDETPEFKHAAKKTRYDTPDSRLQLAWLIRAKQVAKTVRVGKFSEDALEAAIAELRGCLSDVRSIAKVPSILAKAGVCFVVVEFLPSAKLDGACFWLDGVAPVVALSVRLDRVDNFWHTLFHELDHIAHGDAKDSVIIEDFEELKGKKMPANERRANEAAAEYCVPQQSLDAWLASSDRNFSRHKIVAFARQVNVHPGLVVGQLQRREIIPWSFHRELLEKVRGFVAQLDVTDGFGKRLAL